MFHVADVFKGQWTQAVKRRVAALNGKMMLVLDSKLERLNLSEVEHTELGHE